MGPRCRGHRTSRRRAQRVGIGTGIALAYFFGSWPRYVLMKLSTMSASIRHRYTGTLDVAARWRWRQALARLEEIWRASQPRARRFASGGATRNRCPQGRSGPWVRYQTAGE